VLGSSKRISTIIWRGNVRPEIRLKSANARPFLTFAVITTSWERALRTSFRAATACETSPCPFGGGDTVTFSVHDRSSGMRKSLRIRTVICRTLPFSREPRLRERQACVELDVDRNLAYPPRPGVLHNGYVTESGVGSPKGAAGNRPSHIGAGIR